MGVGLGDGAFVTDWAGVFTGVTFGAAATVRVEVTDFAHTVTELGPVFEECAKSLVAVAEQAQTGIGDS